MTTRRVQVPSPGSATPDSALALRIAVDSGSAPGDGEIDALLGASALVGRLTELPVDVGLPATWRLAALAEIPFAERLSYTQELAERVLASMATDSGFVLPGRSGVARVDDLLPCYNAIIVRALARLGFASRQEVAAGAAWILRYQPFDRSTRSAWSGSGTRRYGGCLESTPCYIGLVKSVRALQALEQAAPPWVDVTAVRSSIAVGVDTMLDHRLYLRKTIDEPITAHLLDVSFPESYHLNILEVLDVIERAGRLDDPRCAPALAQLAARRNRSTGAWRVSFRYGGAGWLAFDPPGPNAAWVTYLAQRCLTHAGRDSTA